MKKYLMKIKRYIFCQIALDAVVVALLAALPVFQKFIFDRLQEKKEIHLGRFMGAYVVCLIGIVVISYLSLLVKNKGGIEFKRILKNELFSSITRYSHGRFKERDTAGYISIFNNDIQALKEDYLSSIAGIIKTINTIIIYGGAMLIFIHWKLAVLVVASSVLNIIIFPRLTSKKLSRERNEYLNVTEEYVQKFSDLARGIKLFNSRTREQLNREHNKKLDKLSAQQWKYGITKTGAFALNDAATNILNLVIIAAAVIMVVRREISVGTAVASLGFMEAFVDPIQRLMDYLTKLNSSKDVKKKFLKLLGGDFEESNMEAYDFKDSIQMKDVSIKYDTFSMENFTYTFKRGRKYALIGSSGSGKSTILKAAAGINDLNSGKIFIDGEERANSRGNGLISYMDQSEHIFSDTFMNNITLYDSYTPRGLNRIKSSIEKKTAEAVSSSDDCSKLSGGEKKVVSIMRKLVQDSPVIMLDEPFAGADKELSRTLMNRITELEDKTLIMITHGLGEELENFDEILFIKDGEVIHKGSYNEVSHTEEFKKLVDQEAIAV